MRGEEEKLNVAKQVNITSWTDWTLSLHHDCPQVTSSILLSLPHPSRDRATIKSFNRTLMVSLFHNDKKIILKLMSFRMEIQSF